MTTSPGVPAATTLTETGSLPSGVTFTDNGDGTATLAGTPAAGTGGSYALTIKAQNTTGFTTQSFTLTVNEKASITSADHTTFVVGSGGLVHGDHHGRLPGRDHDHRDRLAAVRGELHRQRRRHRHPGGHPGGRHWRAATR